jgi:hypothetical protein
MQLYQNFNNTYKCPLHKLFNLKSKDTFHKWSLKWRNKSILVTNIFNRKYKHFNSNLNKILLLLLIITKNILIIKLSINSKFLQKIDQWFNKNWLGFEMSLNNNNKKYRRRNSLWDYLDKDMILTSNKFGKWKINFLNKKISFLGKMNWIKLKRSYHRIRKNEIY